MYNTNIDGARTNLHTLVDMAIGGSEVVNIATSRGNAVIISEADYKALIETVFLSADPAYKKSLLDGKNTPLSECIDESEVTL